MIIKKEYGGLEFSAYAQSRVLQKLSGVSGILAITVGVLNINGLRARPHQLEAIVEKHQPDVIGLQETKVHDDMFPLEEVAKLGYNVFYHGQKGHYGVALLTKETPIAVRRGFPVKPVRWRVQSGTTFAIPSAITLGCTTTPMI